MPTVCDRRCSADGKTNNATHEVEINAMYIRVLSVFGGRRAYRWFDQPGECGLLAYHVLATLSNHPHPLPAPDISN